MKVTIVCGSGNFSDPMSRFQWMKRYEFEGIEVLRLNVGYSHYHGFSVRITHFIRFLVLGIFTSFRTGKIDFVYASSTPLTVGLLGIWYKRILGKRFVFETVDLWPDVPIGMGIVRHPWLVKAAYACERWIYAEAEHIVCLSEGMRDEILKKGIEAHKITVSHNGTNGDLFQPSQTKESAKIALGYHENDFIVLYAGTIGLANGLEQLVDLATFVSTTRIRFLVLGDGNRKQEVMHYAQLRHACNVQFVSAVPKEEVIRYFAAADVGAVFFAPYPILNTNSANKWYDYLAYGLPVMINYEGWQLGYLHKAQCGFGSPDLHVLAQKLTQLAHDPLQYHQMSLQARDLAIQRFDRKLLAQTLLALFEKLRKH